MTRVAMPNHYAVIDNDNIEWLADMSPEATIAMFRRRAIAEELGQKSVTRLLDKWIRGWAATGGKRVNMVHEIAKNEEAIHVASEVFAPRRGV
jgi:hypothetical protein